MQFFCLLQLTNGTKYKRNLLSKRLRENGANVESGVVYELTIPPVDSHQGHLTGSVSILTNRDRIT